MLVGRQDYIGATGFGGDFEVEHAAVFNAALDGGIKRCMELEFGVPTGWPGGKHQETATVVLQQHALERKFAIAAVVLVGGIVVAFLPKGGKTQARVAVWKRRLWRLWRFVR